MNLMAHLLSASLFAGFIIEAVPVATKPSGLAVKSCTGKTIFLDLDPDGPAPIPPHKLKPCHAICCSDEEDGSLKEKPAS